MSVKSNWSHGINSNLATHVDSRNRFMDTKSNFKGVTSRRHIETLCDEINQNGFKVYLITQRAE